MTMTYSKLFLTQETGLVLYAILYGPFGSRWTKNADTPRAVVPGRLEHLCAGLTFPAN